MQAGPRTELSQFHSLVTAVAMTGLLGGLLGNLLGSPDDDSSSGGTSTAPTAAEFRTMARFARGDGKLRRGCRNYSYRYRIAPPPGAENWGIEMFLRGPRGGRVASDVILSGADPTSGRKSFRVCKRATRAGIFTIRGKVTVADYPDSHAGWATPERFRLRR